MWGCDLPSKSTGVDIIVEGVALGEPFLERLSQIDNEMDMHLAGQDSGTGGDGGTCCVGKGYLLVL